MIEWIINNWAAVFNGGPHPTDLAIAWLLPAIISGVTALGGLLGNRGQKATKDTSFDKMNEKDLWNLWNQFQTEETQSSGTEAPTMDPYQATTRDAILAAFMNRLRASQDMSPYAAQGYRNINQGADLQKKALASMLAQRGLSGSAVGANALAGAESSRLGSIVNFANQLPIMQRQMEMEDLTNFGNFWSKMPFGKTWNQQGYGVKQGFGSENQKGTEHSWGTGQETETTPSNMAGGFVSGLGQGLASTFGWDWAQDQQAKRSSSKPSGGGYINPNYRLPNAFGGGK